MPLSTTVRENTNKIVYREAGYYKVAGIRDRSLKWLGVEVKQAKIGSDTPRAVHYQGDPSVERSNANGRFYASINNGCRRRMTGLRAQLLFCCERWCFVSREGVPNALSRTVQRIERSGDRYPIAALMIASTRQCSLGLSVDSAAVNQC